MDGSVGTASAGAATPGGQRQWWQRAAEQLRMRTDRVKPVNIRTSSETPRAPIDRQFAFARKRTSVKRDDSCAVRHDLQLPRRLSLIAERAARECTRALLRAGFA